VALWLGVRKMKIARAVRDALHFPALLLAPTLKRGNERRIVGKMY